MSVAAGAAEGAGDAVAGGVAGGVGDDVLGGASVSVGTSVVSVVAVASGAFVAVAVGDGLSIAVVARGVPVAPDVAVVEATSVADGEAVAVASVVLPEQPARNNVTSARTAKGAVRTDVTSKSHSPLAPHAGWSSDSSIGGPTLDFPGGGEASREAVTALRRRSGMKRKRT